MRTEYLQIVYECYEIYIRLNIQPEYTMSDWNKTNLLFKDKIYLPSDTDNICQKVSNLE